MNDLESFRKWMLSEESPEKVPLFFLAGEVWIDMSKEQFFSHNQLKQEFFRVLGGLVKRERLGTFCPDGTLITNIVRKRQGLVASVIRSLCENRPTHKGSSYRNLPQNHRFPSAWSPAHERA